MSLLSRQVYANPTTPLWAPAGRGGGGGNVIPYGSAITFAGPSSNPTLLQMDTDAVVGFFDASGAAGNFGTVETGDLRVYGAGPGVGAFINFGASFGSNLGVRSVLDDGTLQNNFIAFDSGGMELSNLTAINGVPYFNSPGTQFDFQAQGGTALAEAPDVTVLNALSFTAPANGKLYMEAMGNFISTTQFGGLGLGLAVGGTTISNSLTFANAYDSNINLPAVSMYQIPVTGNTVYDVSAIAFCSALPPAGSDMVVQTSRLFLMFSPQ